MRQQISENISSKVKLYAWDAWDVLQKQTDLFRSWNSSDIQMLFAIFVISIDESWILLKVQQEPANGKLYSRIVCVNGKKVVRA